MEHSQFDKIKDYYGRVLSSKNDLKTSACCPTEAVPPHLRPTMKLIHPEVSEKFYGCGVPLPPALKGLTIVDLGCGTGRDAYVLSKLVGVQGRVIGVDMTSSQIDIARRHLDYHRKAFGYESSNVDFREGYIENLASLDIADNSVDLVVSNCVMNLSPDKEKLFSEIWRVLKPGGELYFSDVFCDRRLPQWMQEDKVLLGECLGGAMYTEDYRRIMHRLGCADPRTVSTAEIQIHDEETKQKVRSSRFFSITQRAFKLELEDRCEDYGQIGVYKGTLDDNNPWFKLDDHHLFEAGKPMPVCANTAAMLQNTRYGEYFEVIGDCSTHFGLFDCSPAAQGQKLPDSSVGCC